MAVDLGVPDSAGRVVSGIRGEQQLSAEGSAEIVEHGGVRCSLCLWKCLDRCHVLLLAWLRAAMQNVGLPASGSQF
jgi:hypothetical protein